MVLGSRFGIDKNAHVHLSTFSHDGEWTEAIEKMVSDGVRIINHSYAIGIGDNYDGRNYSGYTEGSYFLDYISRRYGVINVIAPGNDGEYSIHLISDYSLSFNSVVVGALHDKSSTYSQRTNKIAEYSNYKLSDDYNTLAKPLVVAPAKFYNFFTMKNMMIQKKYLCTGQV